MNSRIPQILRLCSRFYSLDSSKRKALLHQLEELGENSNHPIFNWSRVMHWIHYVLSSLPYTDCSVRASVQSSAQLGSNSAGLKRKKQKQNPQQKSEVPQSQWAWETPEACGKRPILPPASGPARHRFLPLPRPPLPTPRPAPPLGLGSPGGGRMAIPGGCSRWMPWRRYEAIPRGGTGAEETYSGNVESSPELPQTCAGRRLLDLKRRPPFRTFFQNNTALQKPAAPPTLTKLPQPWAPPDSRPASSLSTSAFVITTRATQSRTKPAEAWRKSGAGVLRLRPRGRETVRGWVLYSFLPFTEVLSFEMSYCFWLLSLDGEWRVLCQSCEKCYPVSKTRWLGTLGPLPVTPVHSGGN